MSPYFNPRPGEKISLIVKELKVFQACIVCNEDREDVITRKEGTAEPY